MIKKISIAFIGMFLCSALIGQTKDNMEYILIHVVVEKLPQYHTKGKVARINSNDIKKLDEPLKALAAYYCGLGGSNCDINANHKEVCDLTSALGLENQGSSKHLSLLQKWFHDDSIVTKMISQNCFLSISGSNDFSNYSYLKFKQSNDTIWIKCKLDYYNSGNSRSETFNEMAIIKKNEIKFIKRKLIY